jgi:predicted HAD superfamily Cof-like phosphohydrolase
MEKQIRDIREFQTKLVEVTEGHLLEEKTIEAFEEAVRLRRELLMEEVKELNEAMDLGDSVEILDAGVDILYIVLGTMHEAGVLDKFSQAWDLVHSNNMTKLDENGKVHKNENGKVIKPANYKPVNLNQLF